MYNMLDMPAGVVPTGTVRREDDEALMDDTQWATDGNILLKWMRSAAANSVGLPVGVQVVAMRWEEEKCLGLMNAIEAMAKAQKK
ncbi:hypothetical protein niasHS_005309 [Heterodera schachtii]|uniref:Amidase domain-containing protein n=1 Tax=Heterodera schachtii TaxID=97005 RepID=A0ABD2J8X8_HETSC